MKAKYYLRRSLINVIIYVSLFLQSSYGFKVALNTDRARIVGGTASSIEKAPFIVAVYAFGQFICGGSLITTELVVTAAHCVKGMSASLLMVVGGVTKLTDHGVRRGIKKIYLPKEYNAKNYHMDVAVLQLSGRMEDSRIGTIELCTKTLTLGRSIEVYGWGLTSEKALGHSNVLHSVTVPLITRQECKRLYKDHNSITSSMFCAGDLKHKDSCSGDSGGPAIYEGELCGIVSWGVGCARSNYPGVYTKISNVRNFLKKAMEK